jgi:hypothetical protein
VIIENYFGKLQEKFRNMTQPFRSEREIFSFYFKICHALTNFYIVYCQFALPEEDQELYIGLINKIKREGENIIKKIKEKTTSQYLKKISQCEQNRNIRSEKK